MSEEHGTNNNLKSGSNLEKLLRKGEFVVTSELGPPRGASRKAVEEKAALLKGYADAFNLTDCQTAMVRLSSIASGAILLNMGMEPVVQLTCRDRNRIAMQSDILGAAALGMKNLLCLTGDHQCFGDHPEAKGVFDLDSINQLDMFRQMRDEKKFQSGGELKTEEPKLFLGAAENPFADPFQYRAARLAKKIKAGADFIQTQIIYNVEKFEQWMGMVREMGLHKKVSILAGVTPIRSLGMAKYMKKNVPGMDVPDEIIKRLEGAEKKKAEGINICLEVIERVRKIEGVAGVHIMAVEWEEIVPEITERAGLLPRPTP
ncbi:MAG: methylenetetrahydrofolate reductase [Candidatus Scalindua sp.]|jgi:methylenetetrahydrofolate reductase (NADPH)|nr:methylenetetrahydrofolate reductase [Candidatus Scalindua sp.]MBT5306576.1 methylenetetrahydrofolate reductase [Candidatus Scalindua sp.]MBT6231323.1 methylenetetrahydrofolate reductase [Candidatus Scalindua sp.]MBT6562541.1 methylenetetrahydrofolate reductase [Candidatus Scalindua sp.]MBT7212603.1 methylenetetrahydrofolate reductase [Candidatus Scalindua sp.]